MRAAFFYSLFVLLFSTTCFAQNDSVSIQGKRMRYDDARQVVPVEIDDERIESYKENPSFQYVEPQESWWTQFTTWLKKIWRQFLNWILGSELPGGAWAYFLLKLLPYIILLGILALAVWLFIRFYPHKGLLTNKKPSVFFSDDEKIIEEEDIPNLIHKAKDARNYRLAVRYYYLLLLKNLRDQEWIDYQFEKTNEDYAQEISSKNLSADFSSISHIYDFLWYGDFSLEQQDFNKVESDFIRLQDSLKNNVYAKNL